MTYAMGLGELGSRSMIWLCLTLMAVVLLVGVRAYVRAEKTIDEIDRTWGRR